MRVVDRVVIAFSRRIRRRRRKLELEATLPGLEGYVPSVPAAVAHTAARRGAPATLVRPGRVKVALAAAVLARIPAAYIAGGTTATAVAAEEADRQIVEEASSDYTAVQMREAAALSAAVAAYSAEREASDEVIPEAVAEERLRDRGLTDQQVAEELEGIAGLLGKSHEEAVALEMWEAEPPETAVAGESIREYEDASREAGEARIAWERAWDERFG